MTSKIFGKTVDRFSTPMLIGISSTFFNAGQNATDVSAPFFANGYNIAGTFLTVATGGYIIGQIWRDMIQNENEELMQDEIERLEAEIAPRETTEPLILHP